MNIIKAQFLCSSERCDQCPPLELHEFAFIGRSNVGKSSLINMLTGSGSLAKVSATPGKTKLINHFIIDSDGARQWALVDLPGYGFAKVSKKDREVLEKMIRRYILDREQLYCLFVLVDSRHAPQKIDTDFMEFLAQSSIPFAIVMTKADKLSQRQLNLNIKNYKAHLNLSWESLPPMMATSAEKGGGKEELLTFIEQNL
ncbi:MAG: ribosome biogenesis GTP-binding protein YihA/YsxC [Mucinivorans sp.]